MAYPFVDAAYGFRAVNQLSGLPYAGATRQIPIGYAYGTSIFNGDLVELAAGVVTITGMTTATAGTARALVHQPGYRPEDLLAVLACQHGG
jgi:hypothetical protein